MMESADSLALGESTVKSECNDHHNIMIDDQSSHKKQLLNKMDDFTKGLMASSKKKQLSQASTPGSYNNNRSASRNSAHGRGSQAAAQSQKDVKTGAQSRSVLDYQLVEEQQAVQPLRVPEESSVIKEAMTSNQKSEQTRFVPLGEDDMYSQSVKITGSAESQENFRQRAINLNMVLQSPISMSLVTTPQGDNHQHVLSLQPQNPMILVSQDKSFSKRVSLQDEVEDPRLFARNRVIDLKSQLEDIRRRQEADQQFSNGSDCSYSDGGQDNPEGHHQQEYVANYMTAAYANQDINRVIAKPVEEAVYQEQMGASAHSSIVEEDPKRSARFRNMQLQSSDSKSFNLSLTNQMTSKFHHLKSVIESSFSQYHTHQNSKSAQKLSLEEETTNPPQRRQPYPHPQMTWVSQAELESENAALRQQVKVLLQNENVLLRKIAMQSQKAESDRERWEGQMKNMQSEVYQLSELIQKLLREKNRTQLKCECRPRITDLERQVVDLHRELYFTKRGLQMTSIDARCTETLSQQEVGIEKEQACLSTGKKSIKNGVILPNETRKYSTAKKRSKSRSQSRDRSQSKGKQQRPKSKEREAPVKKQKLSRKASIAINGGKSVPKASKEARPGTPNQPPKIANKKKSNIEFKSAK